MLDERKRTLTLSASFRREEEEEEEEEGDRAIFAAHHDSPQQISAVPDNSSGEVGGGGGGDDDDDFDFSFAIADPDTAAITADEIFSNGRIRPVYPVFDRSLLLFDDDDDDDDDADPAPSPSSSSSAAARTRGVRLPLGRLLMEERNSSVGSNSSSSSSTASEPSELEGVAPETYCLWTPGSAPPSPTRCRKSGSTGSIVRWRRISDLVIGRSRSDGKDKFLFLQNPNPNPSPEPKAEEAKKAKAKAKEMKGGKVTEVDTVTAHRVLYYGKPAKGGRRVSFLPYKQDLVGIFANVNGVTRPHHPL